MARFDKIIEKWNKNVPTEVPIGDVMKVVKSIGFNDVHSARTGSHQVIIFDKALYNKPGFKGTLVNGEYYGILTLPVHKGKVMGVYINSLLKAIKFKEG